MSEHTAENDAPVCYWREPHRYEPDSRVPGACGWRTMHARVIPPGRGHDCPDPCRHDNECPHGRASVAGEDCPACASELKMARIAKLVDQCYMVRSNQGIRCSDLIGVKFPQNSTTWSESMCCLPCRIRLVLDSPPGG